MVNIITKRTIHCNKQKFNHYIRILLLGNVRRQHKRSQRNPGTTSHTSTELADEGSKSISVNNNVLPLLVPSDRNYQEIVNGVVTQVGNKGQSPEVDENELKKPLKNK